MIWWVARGMGIKAMSGNVGIEVEAQENNKLVNIVKLLL